MIIKNIIIISILFTQLFLYGKSSSNIKSSQEIQDSLKNKQIISTNNQNVENRNFILSWYSKNEGTFWTFIFSTMTALIVLYLSHKIIKKRDMKQKENIYCGLLFSIYADFVNHEICSNFIRKELEEILRLSKENQKLVAFSPLTNMILPQKIGQRVKLGYHL